MKAKIVGPQSVEEHIAMTLSWIESIDKGIERDLATRKGLVARLEEHRNPGPEFRCPCSKSW